MNEISAQYFPNFQTHRIDIGEVEIHALSGGQGPPLLMLHGYPQTHLIWRKIAPVLAERFTVITTDLRGYGYSDKPFGTDDHATYSKRVMAQDQVDVMAHLGFDKFYVAGHDRGGRVAHRMALDHRDKVKKLAVLDICPTAYMYRNTDLAFASAYYHWFFLIQPYDFPERFLQAEPEYYIRAKLGSLLAHGDAISEDVMTHYIDVFREPEAIHAMCEDYRASASIDLEHDDADADTKLSCPLLVIWGENGVVGKLYDPPAVWREKADEVVPLSLPCGHFIPEEKPQETVTAFLEFFV